jgi:hypothetical protein
MQVFQLIFVAVPSSIRGTLVNSCIHIKALTPPHDTEGMGRKGGGER